MRIACAGDTDGTGVWDAGSVLGKVLISREYAKLWLAGAISQIGDYVFDVTVVLWVAVILARGKPWAPAAVSGVIAAVLVVTVVVGPFAGVFADRWDQRRTMMACDAARTVLIGGLAALPLLPAGTLPVSGQLACIYAVVVVSTAISRFFTPARFAIIAAIVEPAKRAKAASIGQATAAMAGMIGPPLAAPLLFGSGVVWALVIDAASFGLSFLAIAAVRAPAAPVRRRAQAGSGVWTELRTGAGLVIGSRVLLAIVVSSMVANFGAYLLNTLNVFFLTHNLHARASLFGLLDPAFGIGAVLGAVLAGALGQRLGLSRIFWTGLLGTGLMIVAYSRSSAFVAGLALILILAVPLSALNTVVAPIIMRSVPQEALGRVYALIQPAVQVMSVVAVAIAGWLSSSVLNGLHADVLGVHLGTYDAIFGLAGLLIALCGVYAMVALRGADQAVPPASPPVPVAEAKR